jgi:hypothetical protein
MKIQAQRFRMTFGPDVWHFVGRADGPGHDVELLGFHDTSEQAREVVSGKRGGWSRHESLDVFTCEDGSFYAFGTIGRPTLIPVE